MKLIGVLEMDNNSANELGAKNFNFLQLNNDFKGKQRLVLSRFSNLAFALEKQIEKKQESFFRFGIKNIFTKMVFRGMLSS